MANNIADVVGATSSDRYQFLLVVCYGYLR